VDKYYSMRNYKVSKFWSIPVLTAYVYTAAVLAQYGYLSYFEIPSTYVESSIQGNILYFFSLFQAAIGAIALMKWWWALLAGLILIIIFDLYNSNRFWRKVLRISFIIIFFSSIWLSYKLGHKSAELNTTFLVLENNCTTLDAKYTYIIPTTYRDKMIIMPIDSENKIFDSFMVKDGSDLDCFITKKEIGQVYK
jgi:hypothetical protein